MSDLSDDNTGQGMYVQHNIGHVLATIVAVEKQ
jgi:hypothetical protein